MDSKPPSPSPMSGGFLLALALLIGVVIGMATGQPTIGFLAGLAIGSALMTLIWALDRRRG